MAMLSLLIRIFYDLRAKIPKTTQLHLKLPLLRNSFACRYEVARLLLIGQPVSHNTYSGETSLTARLPDFIASVAPVIGRKVADFNLPVSICEVTLHPVHGGSRNYELCTYGSDQKIRGDHRVGLAARRTSRCQPNQREHKSRRLLSKADLSRPGYRDRILPDADRPR